MARPSQAARRSHEACRRPCAAPADDGGDGTTGLRTMRIQLSGLFGRHLPQKGRATESLRARWQRNHPHTQGAAPGARPGAGGGTDPSKTPTPAGATVAPAAAPGCSRECPTEARFLSRTRLNKASSAKETWHIEFDLTASGIDYAVGDAFGVFPANDPAFVANLKKSGRYQQDVY